MSAQTSIVGHDTRLIHYDVPAAVISDMRSLVVNEATIETTMNVTAREDSTTVNSKTTASGSASIGFGLFKASASFSAAVGVDKHQRHKSDYSSSSYHDFHGTVRSPEVDADHRQHE